MQPVHEAACVNTMKTLFTALLLLLAIVSASAQVAYIREKFNGRVIVLTVARATAERLERNQLTEADRKELRAARDWALGVGETKRAVCIGHYTPHDISRWLRCPAQNIRRQ